MVLPSAAGSFLMLPILGKSLLRDLPEGVFAIRPLSFFEFLDSTSKYSYLHYIRSIFAHHPAPEIFAD